VPDFESGYYLASYKCVCKANYEFPFIDYGTSYFEGGTVEKEYDKKVRGLSNIYDRLKCRQVTLKNSYGKEFFQNSAIRKFNFLLCFIIYNSIILLYFNLI
jgi:hypothetical protein